MDRIVLWVVGIINEPNQIKAASVRISNITKKRYQTRWHLPNDTLPSWG
jgi:hypothetical protein